MYRIEEIKNKILCGDALEVLKEVPDESVDTIITSPPYWGLRDYGVEGQIGLEKTLDEYLNKMLLITAELKRVLKKTGTMWWNHGDCYNSHSTGKGNVGGIEGKRKNQWDNVTRGKIKIDLPDKCLVLQNWRLVLRMIDEQGFILRNCVIWEKPNHMPSSIKDRLTNSYEPVFFLVKSLRYFFDLDAIRVPPKTMEKRPYGIIREREFGYNTKYPQVRSFNYRVCNAEKKSKQCPQFKSTKEEIERYKQEWERQKQLSYGNDDKGARRSRVMAGLNIRHKTHYPQDQAESSGSPRARYWRNIDPRGNDKGGPGSWRVFKEDNPCFTNPKGKNPGDVWEIPYHPAGDPTIHGMRLPPQPNQEGAFHPLGKNPGDLWTIPTQPAPPEVRGKHFATFPEKLVEPMILAGCPSNGIVLDPFAGSCTTAVVAKKLGRNYIMIEINPEYCEVGRKRLEKIPSPLPLEEK